MVVHCDRCKKRANIYTLIGTYHYCDKCVGLVRITCKKLLGYYNDNPNVVLSRLRDFYREIDKVLAK